MVWIFKTTFSAMGVPSRGGVLEDVLEDTFWSPLLWPWPRSLKSSKIALSSARGQHYFWTVEISLENARNLAENLQRPFFLVSSSRDRLKKIFEDLFLRSPEKKFWRLFFRTLASVFLVLGLGLERVCPWPWPRNFFVSLALASSFVSSTPSLVPSLLYNVVFML